MGGWPKAYGGLGLMTRPIRGLSIFQNNENLDRVTAVLYFCVETIKTFEDAVRLPAEMKLLFFY